jgi:predicted aspartyl protease
METEHLVIEAKLRSTTGDVEVKGLVDCGATGFAFIDEEFVRKHNLPKFKLRTPRALEVIDGRPISSGDITHIV